MATYTNIFKVFKYSHCMHEKKTVPPISAALIEILVESEYLINFVDMKEVY